MEILVHRKKPKVRIPSPDAPSAWNTPDVTMVAIRAGISQSASKKVSGERVEGVRGAAVLNLVARLLRHHRAGISNSPVQSHGGGIDAAASFGLDPGRGRR